MSSNISKEVSQLLSQMLNNLSNEYPNISKDLTKKNKIFKKNNTDKEAQKINKIKILRKEHPAIFQRIKKILGTSVDYQNDSPRYAQVDWDNQDFELSALYAGSYSSKYEDSIETQNSEFDSIFN